MKRILRWVVMLAAAGLVVLQFMRPSRNIPPADPSADFIAQYRPPGEIVNILRAGCYDCHSNETRYPWYAEIQPVGWWLNDHIEDAKGELNFSEWGSYRVRRRFRKLEEMITQVEKSEMPLPSYLWMHADAQLSSEQKRLFLEWVGAMRDTIKSTTPADSLARPHPAS